MSSENASPLLPLTAGLMYTGDTYPFVAGSFFVDLFGSNSQREYDRLKERFGKAALVGFFPQFEAFFEYVLREDPESPMFTKVWTMSSAPVLPNPDPAVDLPAFITALHSAGTAPGKVFDTNLLLGRLLTPAVRDRAYHVLNRTYGVGANRTLESILGAMIVDAAKTA